MAEVNTVDTRDFAHSEPEPTRPSWRTAVGLGSVFGLAYVASHWQQILASVGLS